jgi:periplasmic protein TonB
MPEPSYDITAFISQRLAYTDTAFKAKIEGRANVQFVIDSTGKITDVKTVGTPLGYGLDEEARRVIGMMPPWKPGSQNGRRVNVYYTLPILFRLAD